MADTIYFLLAVAATSTLIFMLMTRAENAGRRASSDDAGTSSTSDGWTASWFGSNHYGPTSDLMGSGDSGNGWSGGSDGGIGGGSSN